MRVYENEKNKVGDQGLLSMANSYINQGVLSGFYPSLPD